MFCPKCGTKLNDENNTCPSCGFVLEEKKEEVLDSPVEQENEVQPATSEEKKDTSVTDIDTDTQELLEKEPEIAPPEHPELQQQEPEPAKITMDVHAQPLPETNLALEQQTVNNNRTVIIVLGAIIIFILLFVLAIYLIFFSNKTEKETTIEPQTEEKSPFTADDAKEVNIKEGKKEVTFLLNPVCYDSKNDYNTENSSMNYYLFFGTGVECSSTTFRYNDFESAEESADFYESNPYWEEANYDVKRYTTRLNNGKEIIVVQLTENSAEIFYPMGENENVEMGLSADNITANSIRQLIKVKE